MKNDGNWIRAFLEDPGNKENCFNLRSPLNERYINEIKQAGNLGENNMTDKQEIFQNLKKQILSLEGFKEPLPTDENRLGRISEAFPNHVFPFSALHEFFYFNAEEATASSAFIASLLSSSNYKGGTIVWISTTQTIFPPALKWFGIPPHHVLFLQVRKEKDILWAIHEALKCSSLSAVVGELPEMSLTASRRFQLAIEDAGVGGFILRNKPKNVLTTSVSRWHIKPLHSKTEDDLPGIGHPCWSVNLLKVRNGKTGSWDIEWTSDGFRYIPSKLALIHKALQKQTG
jgi:protein ImuA